MWEREREWDLHTEFKYLDSLSAAQPNGVENKPVFTNELQEHARIYPALYHSEK